jgi:hypothetical protein
MPESLMFEAASRRIGQSKEAFALHALTAKRLVRPRLGVGAVLELFPFPAFAGRLRGNGDEVRWAKGVAVVFIEKFTDTCARLFGILS